MIIHETFYGKKIYSEIVSIFLLSQSTIIVNNKTKRIMMLTKRFFHQHVFFLLALKMNEQWIKTKWRRKIFLACAHNLWMKLNIKQQCLDLFDKILMRIFLLFLHDYFSLGACQFHFQINKQTFFFARMRKAYGLKLNFHRITIHFGKFMTILVTFSHSGCCCCKWVSERGHQWARKCFRIMRKHI